MSVARLRAVYGVELAALLRRPLFWVLVSLLLVFAWGFSLGNIQIGTGDASVGGTKAWITSEFNFAFLLSVVTAILYSFFVSIAAGMAIIADDELKVGEVLHATPLTPGEYVWGKFGAILTAFLGVLLLHLLFAMFFNHVPPNAAAAEVRGPFLILNYLRPAFVFGLPTLVFFAGISFYLGERLRRPMAVFLFPMLVLVASAFFLWSWAPTWLDPRINRFLMLIDPSGFRWLNETWLKLDRGAKFYNTARIGLDAGFVVSRIVFSALGLLAVGLAQRDVARQVRGRQAAAGKGQRGPLPLAPAVERGPRVAAQPLATLGMSTRVPGLFAGIGRVASTELRHLLSRPGLYLLLAFILLQTVGGDLIALGPFQTSLLITSGQAAAGSFNTLSLLLCFLLLFYTVESLEAERATGIAPLAYSSPTPSAAILFGKSIANSLIGVLAVVATWLGCVVVILIQKMQLASSPGIELRPFLLVWGLLLVPTFVLWTSFVTAVQAIARNRYTTYGVGLGAIALTGYLQLTDHLNWVGNWMMWSAVKWTDIGTFELDRKALFLSRLFALGLAGLFTAVAVRAFSRRDGDAIGTLNRLRPAALGRLALVLLPFAVVPAVAGTWLYLGVFHGFQGNEVKKKQKDYWTQNLGTWREAPTPALAAADLAVSLEPARRSFHTHGTYSLINDQPKPIERFAVTAGPHWSKTRWTMAGKAYKPEDRTGLYVFVPPASLPPGGKLEIGFDYDGVFPQGVSENGGGTGEFVLPSAVVLTSFDPSFVPFLGFDETRGVDKDNRYEPRVYPPDFYKGQTDAGFGGNAPFDLRLAVTAPDGITVNGVGTKIADTVAKGRRTVVWQTDHPVRFFNIVAGRYEVKRGNGTAIYYDRRHPYNIEAMSRTLDAARRYYSEWFYPYPWHDLKISEFPALANYAQGFPTNISFSEGIGFLAKSDIETDAAFMVTAHESAHQWWGSIITPGKGPGADLLSEGMAHFSTMLLTEQVKGLAARIEFCKRLEENYGNSRKVDAEHPLVEVDGSRKGDQTVTYDKGGWVFWMTLQQLGRERGLAAIHQFVSDWTNSLDHPVLQDFTAALRPFAGDKAAYDEFVRQWYFQVVVPEYLLTGASKRRLPDGTWEVKVTVKNAGTGRIPVEMAAVTGDRFGKEGKVLSAYRDARAPLVLGANEARSVTIRCPFEPKRVLMDPDAMVLQLRRKAAVAAL